MLSHLNIGFSTIYVDAIGICFYFVESPVLSRSGDKC